MEFAQIESPNPQDHARKIEEILSSLKTFCQDEVHAFHDPGGKALLETTSDVLGALEKAFHDYLEKEMAGWQDVEEYNPQKSLDPWD